MNPSPTLFASSDGSLSAFNEEFGECYSSLSEGALSEKLAKHIAPAFEYLRSKMKSDDSQTKIPPSTKSDIWILDICFGLGYNAFLSVSAFEYLLGQSNPQPKSASTKLHIISLEKDRATLDLARQIWHLDDKKWQSLASGQSTSLNQSTSLTIIWGDASSVLKNLAQDLKNDFASDLQAESKNQKYFADFERDFAGFDIIYQDPFSFGKNPALWSEEHFKHLFAISKSTCLITSYATRKEVLANAQKAGFLAYKLKGDFNRFCQEIFLKHKGKHTSKISNETKSHLNLRESSLFSKQKLPAKCTKPHKTKHAKSHKPQGEPMRIVFMGTPIFATIVFDRLLAELERAGRSCEVLRVITQEDKPVGRKGIITPPPMKQKALQKGIEVLQPRTLDSAFSQALASLQIDFILVVAFGKILPKSILQIAPCINVHASILPKYRGASPIQQMILSDDSHYGVSIMAMEEGLDSGGILGVSKIPRNDEDYTALSATLAQLGGAELARVLCEFDTITPLPQDESKASYCKKICKADGEVRFTNASEIYKKSLAFSPWPSVFMPNGIKIFGIKVAQIEASGAKAGEVLSISPTIVACQKGAIEIDELQAPSKNKMRASEFLKTRGIKIGTNLLDI